MSADSYADLLERLFAAYESRHSLATIEDVVTQCRTELAGQAPALSYSNDSCGNA